MAPAIAPPPAAVAEVRTIEWPRSSDRSRAADCVAADCVVADRVVAADVLDNAEPLPRGDAPPRPHRGAYGQVRGAQRTVGDRDDALAGEPAGVGDLPGARRVHRLTRPGGQV